MVKTSSLLTEALTTNLRLLARSSAFRIDIFDEFDMFDALVIFDEFEIIPDTFETVAVIFDTAAVTLDTLDALAMFDALAIFVEFAPIFEELDMFDALEELAILDELTTLDTAAEIFDRVDPPTFDTFEMFAAFAIDELDTLDTFELVMFDMTLFAELEIAVLELFDTVEVCPAWFCIQIG